MVVLELLSAFDQKCRVLQSAGTELGTKGRTVKYSKTDSIENCELSYRFQERDTLDSNLGCGLGWNRSMTVVLIEVLSVDGSSISKSLFGSCVIESKRSYMSAGWRTGHSAT